VNKCDWIAQFALFSQFVTCLGRIVHHSPSYNTRSRMSHPIQILVGCSYATRIKTARIKYCRCPRNWVSRIGNSGHELWTL
jgi:hypothetical protein